MQRIRQMVVKEFIQLIRDKRSLGLLIIPPLLQLLILGYAVTFEVRHIATAILDLDNTPESRDLITRFSASRYFDIVAHLSNQQQITELMRSGDVAMAIDILPGFGGTLRKGKTASVQIVVDGSNSNTALVVLGYVNQITDDFAKDYQNLLLERSSPQLVSLLPSVELERRPLFNADLLSLWNFIPGVIGLLALIQVVSLTAFAVVREREIGTLEQLMVTPIRRWELVFSKTVPFFLVGLADAVLIAVAGTWWFGVPFRGSVWVLLLGLVIFLFCVLSIGLFISTVSKTQQQAMVSAFFFQQPAIVFSGFGFPIASMPASLQWLSYLDPLRYFEVVLRDVYLKGVGLSVLWPQLLAMGVFAPILFAVSILRFQKSID
jgi:ABC-2 type transport system permease protein